MGKAKRKGGLSGVSRFVFESMKSDPSNPETASSLSNQNADADAEWTVNRPAKRRKGNDGTPVLEETHTKWIEKYDVTGLVPHYTHASQVPEHLQKYFSQRQRYFSLYSTPPGCLLDEEGWYSVTPERLADQIAERCRCDTIVDAFCGVGGNAIAFAKTCQRVIALDTSPTRLALARHNAQIYGVADRIEFILGDYLTFIKSYTSLPSTSAQNVGNSEGTRKIDVVFLSPPWGGPSYLSGSPNGSSTKTNPIFSKPTSSPITEHPYFSLSSVQPIHGAKLFDLTRKITKNIAYYLPRNTQLHEISTLVLEEQLRTGQGTSTDSQVEQIEVEEEWMGNKLKALTCYFGGLVHGQEVYRSMHGVKGKALSRVLAH